jgi:hypothetical protein
VEIGHKVKAAVGDVTWVVNAACDLFAGFRANTNGTSTRDAFTRPPTVVVYKLGTKMTLLDSC